MLCTITNASYWFIDQIFEYFEFDHFTKCLEVFNFEQCLEYIYCLLKCLYTFHVYKISHRDIKPSNFLYNITKKRGVLIDLSLSELSPEAVKVLMPYPKKLAYAEKIIFIQNRIGRNKFGTEGYMAPEAVMCEEKQKTAVDMWALGIICLQLFVKKMFIFCPLNMMVFDKQKQKLAKKENYLAHFLLQTSVLLGPNEIKEYCSKQGYFVSFPNKISGGCEKLKSYIRLPDFQEWGWKLVENCLKFDPSCRISSRALLRLLDEKLKASR